MRLSDQSFRISYPQVFDFLLKSLIFDELVDQLIENLSIANIAFPFIDCPEDDADQGNRFTPERLEVSEGKEFVVASVI